MGTKTLMSLAEYERLPEDGMLHELIEGELIAVAHPKYRHMWISHTVRDALNEAAGTHGLGKSFIEMAYLIREDPPTLRVPGVSFVRAERLRPPSDEGYLMFAPDLVAEILSPSDSAQEVREKVRQFLNAGTSVAWVVYPKLREVEVYCADGSARVLNEHQSLELPDLLPGFSLPVAKIFE